MRIEVSRRLLTLLGMITLVIGAGAGVSLALSGWQPFDNGASIANPGASPGAELPGAGSSTGLISDGPGRRAERIQIERLGIDLPIVDGDGIDAPLDRAAHYPGSGWPDGGTNIYVYGHARAGLFLPLWQAKVGDRIALTLADGTTRTYEVATIVPDAPWNAISYVDPTPREQLTVQTSTSEEPTAPRFIVIAYPAP